MKKLFAIVMALVIMMSVTGCGLFTEKGYVYDVDEDGNRSLTDVYTYDSEGNEIDHIEIMDS